MWLLEISYYWIDSKVSLLFCMSWCLESLASERFGRFFFFFSHHGYYPWWFYWFYISSISIFIWKSFILYIISGDSPWLGQHLCHAWYACKSYITNMKDLNNRLAICDKIRQCDTICEKTGLSLVFFASLTN